MTRVILFTFILIFTACKNERDLNKIDEGIIEYNISYSGDSIGLPVLLPKKMTLLFNQNYASYKIEDMMGVFSITNTTDMSRHTHFSTIKFFNNKYRYEGRKDEVPVFFNPETVFQIKDTQDTTMMAGIPCVKSLITDLKEKRTFEAAYTDEFSIKHLNFNTPYKNIRGILMKFEIDLGKMRLELKAHRIIPGRISNKMFMVDDDYRLITRKKMQEIIATMLR